MSFQIKILLSLDDNRGEKPLSRGGKNRFVFQEYYSSEMLKTGIRQEREPV